MVLDFCRTRCDALRSSFTFSGFVFVFFLRWLQLRSSYTRLCSTKDILTINGQFPGPTLYVNKGMVGRDPEIHGRTGPSTLHCETSPTLCSSAQKKGPFDSPMLIELTQVPFFRARTRVKPGTLRQPDPVSMLYPAHSVRTHATVHGAIVVYPKIGTAYPFPKSHKEHVVIIGEWWKADIMEVLYKEYKNGADFSIYQMLS
ncbi:Laccase-10 [Nymphaea thermarum]|nr:Laccase-10 [Nymphaea thermarum]